MNPESAVLRLTLAKGSAILGSHFYEMFTVSASIDCKQTSGCHKIKRENKDCFVGWQIHFKIKLVIEQFYEYVKNIE